MNVQSRKDLPGISQSVRTFCKRSWWAFLIGGIASVILGLIALAAPELALLGLALYFAASVLVDGAVNVVGALSNRSRDGFWFMLVFGVLALIAGAYALVNPPVSVLAMVALSAFVAISLGVMLVLFGYRIRALTEREWLFYLVGGLSILFGAAMLLNPAAGGLSLTFLMTAILLLALAMAIID
jgi:uncharacterized membrane protein HdeD (DUF308 family)